MTGCAKLPAPEELPESTYPKVTRTGVPYINDQQDLSRVEWWKKLNDSTLNNLISNALANNNQIKIAQAHILQAQAELKEAEYAWIPTLAFGGNGFLGRTWDTSITPEGQFAQTPLFSNHGNFRFQGYYAGFLPTYSFNILQNTNLTKLARFSLAKSQAIMQATRLSIISQITGSYFMLLSQKAQKQRKLQLISDLKSLRKLEKVRYEAGGKDPQGVNALDQEIAKQESVIPQINNAMMSTENAIRVLVDENPGPVPSYNSIDKLPIDGIIPSCLPSAVLKNRPDLMIAAKQVKMAGARVGVAYSAFFPNISLTSLIGSASLELVHLLQLSANYWLPRLAASSQILNMSDYQKIKAEKANYYAAYYDYMGTLRSVFADVDDSLTNHEEAQMSYEQSLAVIRAARKNYEIAMVQYNAGAKNYSSVLNSKVNLDNAQLNRVEKKASLLDSIVRVYQVVGGGYKAE